MASTARATTWSVAVLTSLLALSAAAPSGASQRFKVTGGQVKVNCPLTVGGSFEATTDAVNGELALKPEGALDGELAVDLTGIDTGIGLRNTHTREKYLEVQKGPEYATARLTDIVLEGTSSEAPEGDVTFKGVFHLHGQNQPIEGKARLLKEGAGYRVTASFPVEVQAYGIEKPRYLGVGVKDVVQVNVELQAEPVNG